MTEIQIESIYNKYNLEEKSVEKLMEAADWYLANLKRIDVDTLGHREKLAYLGVISECYLLLRDKQFYLESCHRLLISMREDIYSLRFRRLSLYDGLCNLAFFTEKLSICSGFYKKFSSSLNEIIFERADHLAKKLIDNHHAESFMNYDVISGLSGVANVLLAHSHEEKAENALRSIAKYFVQLSCKIKQEGGLAPGWFEQGLDAKTYPNGYVDFSVSHGIAGPLQILAKLWKKNIIVPGHEKAISSIVAEYVSIGEKLQNKIWSGKISIEKYFSDSIDLPYGREGWCYGSVMVSKILMEAAGCIRNSSVQSMAEERILEVAEMDIEKFGLDMPSLCHGYAGASAIFRKLYDMTGNIHYLKQAKKLLNKALSYFSPNSSYGFPYEERLFLFGEVKKKSVDKLDFLEGSAGIIMEMLGWVKMSSGFEGMLLL